MSMAETLVLMRQGGSSVRRRDCWGGSTGPCPNGLRVPPFPLLPFQGIQMNLAPATAAVLLLATIGVHGADAQTVKPREQVQAAVTEPIHVGDVPFNIQVPAGNHAFLEGHGVGTQNYVCAFSASSSSGVAYALFTPQAALFSDDFKQLTSHF